MNYLIHTDAHFGHDKVFEFEPDRISFEQTIKHVKHYVNINDILINLGDVGFNGGTEYLKEYCEACSGKLVLIKGNHDSNKSYTHFYNLGFDFVCERFSLNIYGYKILFSHKPVEVPDDAVNIFGHFHRFNHTIEEYKELYPYLSTEYEIFNQLVIFKNHILITTENDCQPTNLKNILDIHRNTW